MDNTFSVQDGISVHMVNDDQYFLTNNISGDIFEINSTTNLIFEKIKEGSSAQMIVDYLKEIALNSDEIGIDDIIEIIGFFMDNGLIRPVSD